MSSTVTRPNHDIGSHEGLDQVLEQAGMRSQSDPEKQEIRMGAALYLISRHQREKLATIAARQLFKGAVEADPTRVERHTPHGSSSLHDAPEASSAPSFLSAEYGRRVEADRTWSIIHIFTGEVARHEGWPMKGLTSKGATRILRTLNAVTHANG